MSKEYTWDEIEELEGDDIIAHVDGYKLEAISIHDNCVIFYGNNGEGHLFLVKNGKIERAGVIVDNEEEKE